MNCPHCHHEVRDGAAFCPYCGKPIENKDPKESNGNKKSKRILVIGLVAALGIGLLSGVGFAYYHNRQKDPIMSSDEFEASLIEAYQYLEDDDEKAEETFKKLIKVDPKRKEPYQGLYNYYRDRGDVVNMTQIYENTYKEENIVINKYDNWRYNYVNVITVNPEREEVSEVLDDKSVEMVEKMEQDPDFEELPVKEDEEENTDNSNADNDKEKEETDDKEEQEQEGTAAKLPFEVKVSSWAMSGGMHEDVIIQPDGSFKGSYTTVGVDVDKKGITHETISSYSGKMKNIQKLNDKTYKMEIDSQTFDLPDGKVWMEGDIEYTADNNRCLQGNGTVYLYLAGSEDINDVCTGVLKQQKIATGLDPEQSYSLYVEDTKSGMFENKTANPQHYIVEEDKGNSSSTDKNSKSEKDKKSSESKTLKGTKKDYKIVDTLADVDEILSPSTGWGYVFEKDGKYGLISTDNEILIDPTYDTFIQSDSSHSSDNETVESIEEASNSIFINSAKYDDFQVVSKNTTPERWKESAYGIGGVIMNADVYDESKGQIVSVIAKNAEKSAGITPLGKGTYVVFSYPSVDVNKPEDYLGYSDSFYIINTAENKKYGPYQVEDAPNHSSYSFTRNRKDQETGDFIRNTSFGPNPPVSGIFKTDENGVVQLHSTLKTDTVKDSFSDGSKFEKAIPITDAQMKVYGKNKMALIDADMNTLFEGDVDDIAGKVNDKILVKKDGKWLLIEAED